MWTNPHVFISFMYSRAPILDISTQALPKQLAQTRHPYGTREGLLTVASFRTWRGS